MIGLCERNRAAYRAVNCLPGERGETPIRHPAVGGRSFWLFSRSRIARGEAVSSKKERRVSGPIPENIHFFTYTE